jgi:vesicular inhibitory amino acid transporter
MSNLDDGAIEISSGGDGKKPAENTPLLGETSSDLLSSPASSENNFDSIRLWEELNEPWPSTFERSISLLASPSIRANDVAMFTKSPKPGSTPQALARRSNLDRGYYTPDHNSLFPPSRTKTRSDSEGNFQQGIAKIQSLDFTKNQSTVKHVQVAQMKKAKEAADYRANILKKKDEEEGAMTPGYGREMASMRAKQQQEAQMPEKTEAKATFSQCVFNLSNILMGVGLLGLPFVFKSAGWFGGSFCLSVFSFITWRTSILIGRELNGDPRPSHCFDDSPFKSPLQPGSMPESRMLPPLRSFPEIARAAFGGTGSFVLAVILYFELFSCLCVFFVTIGDHLHELFPAISVTHHMMTVAAASTIPTMLLRTPKLLSYLSMVGTISTIAVVLAVILSAVLEGDMTERVAAERGIQDARPYHTGWRTEGLMLSFGLVAYCFSGHAIVPAIYTSMARPQDFEKMVTFTFAIVICCCFAVAISGYYMFGSVVHDQVTLSLEQSSDAALAMKGLTWMMILTAFSKYSLTMFPLALGIEELITPYLTSQRMVDSADSTVKLTFTLLALTVSIYVPSFSFLCALVGMICTMSVSVIFPAAAHLRMFGSRLTLADKITDSIFVIVGSVLAVVGTIATLYE